MTADGTLLTALLAFQKDAPTIGLDGNNPAFGGSKYPSLAGIMEAVRPKLAEHDLVWTTMPSVHPETGAPILKYRLAHAPSGDDIEDWMPLLLDKPNPQGLGSALTYARRQSILAVLGLVGDKDDDGNAASEAPAMISRDQAKRIGALRAAVDDDHLRLILQEIGITAGPDVVAVLPSLSADQAIHVIQAMEDISTDPERESDVPADTSGFTHDEPPTPPDEPPTLDDVPFDPVSGELVSEKSDWDGYDLNIDAETAGKLLDLCKAKGLTTGVVRGMLETFGLSADELRDLASRDKKLAAVKRLTPAQALEFEKGLGVIQAMT